MVFETINNYNLTGFFGMVVYVSIVTKGLFPKVLLAFVWCIFVLGGYFSQRNSVGSGDFLQFLAVGGFFLAVSAVFLRVINTGIEGYRLISGYTFAVSMVVACISVCAFLFSDDF